jgi:hypothetical protein
MNNIKFEYILQGTELTLFSKRTDGDIVRLGTLDFTSSSGKRLDLLQAFIEETQFTESTNGLL